MCKEKNYSLLLLAGGKSTRMGQNKAELLYEGRTFAETLLMKGKILGIENIYLSGYERYDKEDSQIQVIRDIYTDRGPLGGIHACMTAMNTPYCIVLPVDVPQIPVSVLQKLMEAHDKQTEDKKKFPLLLKHGERKEYLIAVYPAEMLSFIETQIHKKAESVKKVLEIWGYDCMETKVPEWQLDNINTMEHYKKLLTKIEEGKTNVRKSDA